MRHGSVSRAIRFSYSNDRKIPCSSFPHFGSRLYFCGKNKKQKTMNYPMIAWCAIAGVLSCAFIFRSIERYCTASRNRDCRLRHIFEIGKEKDMFYIPGDIDMEDDLEDL